MLSFDELENHLGKWEIFPLAADNSDDYDTLSELDADMDEWFKGLESLVKDLKLQYLSEK